MLEFVVFGHKSIFIVLSSIAVRLDILGCKQYLDVIFDDFAKVSVSVSGLLYGFELILGVLFVRIIGSHRSF